MRSAWVLALAWLAAATSASAALASTAWSGVEYFYRPEPIASLTGRVFSLESLRAGTPRPLGTLHFVHGEYGYPAFSDEASWNVSDYTGLVTDAAGDGKSSPGRCSAFQVQPGAGLEVGSAGWIMKTDCVPLAADPAHRFVNMQANVTWPAEQMPKPWVTPESRFGLEFSARLTTAGISHGAKAYATAQLAIHDGKGQFFWFQPPVFLAGFKAQAASTDGRGFDQQVPYINPVYRKNGRYLSKFDNPLTGQVSQVTARKPWPDWRWYAFTISRAQLQAAVEDLNANGGKFSTDLAGYGVSFIGIQTEINRQAQVGAKPPQGWIGIALKQIYAYRLY